MTKPFYLLFIGLLLTTAAINLQANNIQVSNVTLTNQNTTDGYTLVQFNLSWENSWRTSSAPNNWDAAWVFVKYRIGAGEWQHAWLNNDGHTGAGATIDAGLRVPGSPFNATTNPALGVFIYRSANGTGAFSITGAKLRWNYGANSVADDATVDVKVFAIEMVYVPEGAFYVGSGGDEIGRFKDGTTNNPFLIDTEGAIEIGDEDGKLWGSSTSGNNSTIGDAGTLPAAFPKGFAAFYSMKYEISQQQYVDFLNTLTQTQATARKYDKPTPNYRYEITGSVIGEYATTNPYAACNFLSWMDGTAYSDWAGLRPMTELEFEKASRGTIAPVANEYAWGNTTATAANNITNGGAANETTTTSSANAVFNSQPNVQGPMRVGVFATGSSTRAQSGASYYGIMELSGNLWERPVTVGNATGRAFTGVHGDGTLSTYGHATEAAWPGLSNGEVTGADGSGFRGGVWNVVATLMRVSDRDIAAFTGTFRNGIGGFRAVRSWPFVCGESQITDIDGNTYNTVQIGNQCWMKENLKTTKYRNNTPIEYPGTDNIAWESNTTGAYAWYNNDVSWKDSYGALYNWHAVNNSNGLCPDGWHVPSDAAWTELTDHLGGESGAGGKLKSTRTDPTSSHPRWNSPNSATNESGFSALPGGGRTTSGAFYHIGTNGRWWSSTEYSSTSAWHRGMFYSSGSVDRNGYDKTSGFSVRCLRDH